VECEAGRYSNSLGLTSCYACDGGHYQVDDIVCVIHIHTYTIHIADATKLIHLSSHTYV
jgi:hypothetical protein